MGDGTAVQHVFVKSPKGAQAGGGSKGACAVALSFMRVRLAAALGSKRACCMAYCNSGAPTACSAAPAAAGQGRPGSLQSREQQQPTVETAVVGSIAATDFSSVAGLGALLPLPAAAAGCLPCVRRRCCCCQRSVQCSALSCVVSACAHRWPAPLPACLQMGWCGSCGRWYCCRCSTQSSSKAWACSPHGDSTSAKVATARCLLTLSASHGRLTAELGSFNHAPYRCCNPSCQTWLPAPACLPACPQRHPVPWSAGHWKDAGGAGARRCGARQLWLESGPAEQTGQQHAASLAGSSDPVACLAAFADGSLVPTCHCRRRRRRCCFC